MKKTILLTTTLTLACLTLLTPALARGPGNGGPGNGGNGDCAAAIGNLPFETVDAEESSSLLHMREEEKLARDVYRAMDDQWGLRVLRNISGAEQRHMDAVLALLEKYDIPDPVGNNSDGEFTDPGMQALYNDLVAQGSESLNQALIVGATIEDLDIYDLDEALLYADNEDIATVYQNLNKGSRNHMRAFISLLEANGVDYEPQFISRAEFDAIIDSPRETGGVDADGNPVDGAHCRHGRHKHGGQRR